MKRFYFTSMEHGDVGNDHRISKREFDAAELFFSVFDATKEGGQA